MAAERGHEAMSAAGVSYRKWHGTQADRRSLRVVRRQPMVASREAGFTLVEVIVALAILSVGLSIVLSVISGGLQQTTNAERKAEAGSLAQSLMAEVGTPIKSEERNGQFPGGYRWHLKVGQYGNGKEREEWPIGLYAISTEVEWEEGAQRRSYELTTLRVGPRGAQQ